MTGFIICVILIVLYLSIMYYLQDKISKSRDIIFNMAAGKFVFPEVINKNNVYNVADNIVDFFKDKNLTKYERDILEYYFQNKDYTIVLQSVKTLKSMSLGESK